MKNIVEHLKTTYFNEIYLESMKDYFGDELPEYVYESMKNNEYCDFILETLRSHDKKSLCDTNNANDLVYAKNHGKLYHFTTGENAKEIERTGLRCKKAKYRNFPERIYAYSSCKKLDQIPDLMNNIYDVINPIEAKRYGVYIYKIDLSKSKNDTYINFYDDDTMNAKDAVYTYNNIPPECISLIKILNL